MKLIELSLSDKEQYNRFVADSPSGSFLQSWEWGQWQEELGRVVYRFFIENSDKQIIASTQFIRMPLWGNKFYLYSPYGPIFTQGFNFKVFFESLKNKFPNMVFVRLESRILKSGIANLPEAVKSINIQPGNTLVLDLQKSTGELLAQMHHKTRYNIKVAERHGVVVEREFVIHPQGGLYFKEAVEMILKTAQRQNFHTYPHIYYEKLLSFFQLHNPGEVKVSLYKALYKNCLLAVGIMVDFGTTRTYLFGGSSVEYRNVMAPYFLHYVAFSEAKVQGLTCYDFDGLETSAGKQAEFARFKKGFGGEEKYFEGAFDLIALPVWYNIYKGLRIINRVITRIHL